MPFLSSQPTPPARTAESPGRPVIAARATMPACASVFSDQQVADLATYVRKRLGRGGSSISASDVATQRAASPSP